MAINNVVMADGVMPANTAVTTLYTAGTDLDGCRVIAFTATNPTSTPATYDVYIIPSGETAANSNKIISNKGMGQDVADVPAAIQNHLIPADGSLAVAVSVANTITFRATGIEF